MICKQCDCHNDADALFCNACGGALGLTCNACGQENRPGSQFCKTCGRPFSANAENDDLVDDSPASLPITATGMKRRDPKSFLGGGRKHVTVLFSDLSGYTAMSERLDPEEVKEIIAPVFGHIAKIINRYEGFIEKYVGDAIMAVFGASRVSEDDPIRAVRAAREIHKVVANLDPAGQERIGQPLVMHTGINTGLVVLGDVDVAHGTHGISGDTVNLAARLCDLSREGEILVGPDTFRHCQGWFRFEDLAPVTFKGRSEPFPVYRVLTSRSQPRKVHRVFGRRGAMIGRQNEMDRLLAAAHDLRNGKGSLVCISGAAGTGKSRLLEEFKTAINSDPIEWYEGHAYPYARNIPYAPLIDLLNLACQIEEGDAPEIVRAKIDQNLGQLIESDQGQLAYIGSLFGIHYPALSEVSPEYWRTRLQKTVRDLMKGLAQTGPVVVCIEDLHWADPSSVDLLRAIALDADIALLLICTYRKTFTLFDHQPPGHDANRLIELADLQPEQALEMVASILDISSIPANLSHFVEEKIEGNPFYLEEMINGLIDRKILVKEGERWVMHGTFDVADISSTIHGVVSGRLDNLPADTRRILQEASVIGRVFDHAILRKITAAPEQFDTALALLEQLDMIRKKDSSSEIKYFFKHAIVQEVVYNGILLKDRRLIHERIAVAMEALFRSRLEGFYETLAFHFSVGQSVYKAVDYLMKSGQKSKLRYAVEEAHQYYQRAYELLHALSERSLRRSVLLVNVLIEWFFVFNVRGVFNEMIALLKQHEEEAEALENAFLRGMYCCCLGWALQRRELLQESHDYLLRALEIGEKSDNREVLAYACGCLVWTCTDLGQLDQAVRYGRRAETLISRLDQDQELIRIVLTGSGIAHWFCGSGHQCQLIGETLLAYGEKGADIRSTSDGYLVCAMGRFASGDFNQTIEYCNMAIASSAGMVHSFNSKFLLAYTYLSCEQADEAETILKDILTYTEAFGYDYLGTAAQALDGMVTLAKGNLARGVRMIADRMAQFKESGKQYHVMTFTYLLGRVYGQLAMKQGPRHWRLLLRNLPFLIRHMPLAARKAETHFKKAVTMAESIGAMGIAGQIYFDMAQLYDRWKRKDLSRQYLNRSITIFQDCKADIYLEKAQRYGREEQSDPPE